MADEHSTLVRHILGIYVDARKEMKAKLAAFEAAHKVKDAKMQSDLASGKISEADYKDWLRGQVFTGKQWKQALDDIVSVINRADSVATKMINGATEPIFADAVNHTVYDIDKGVQGGVSFNIYDENTVKRLLKDNPAILPKWKIDQPKDYKWNQQRARNLVIQGIIQGESIDQIAKRLYVGLSAQNANKMRLFARTAVNGAQNAGRVQGMRECQQSGIDVKKEWMAIHDSRTRDTHADLDGQEQEVDKPFIINGMEINYPGDPTCKHPELVYNCRCTLGWAYPKFAKLQNKGLTYREWEAAHKIGKEEEYRKAKQNLFDVEKQIFIEGADKVFSGIWFSDVTYEDYPDKMYKIPAKKDYFEQKIAYAQNMGDTVMEEKFTKLLALLNEYEANGMKNYMLLTDRNQAVEAVKEIAAQLKLKSSSQKKKKGDADPFNPAAYSKERKNAAIWAKSKRATDAIIRPKTGEVWKSATEEEKDAIYEYTVSFNKFNEPLRGIEYGSSVYKGVGNTDLNAGYANNGRYLNAMTDIIDKSTYDFDIWMQRGCRYGGMDKFLQIDMSLLKDGAQGDLEKALVGKEITEYGFMSCGTTKGEGFSGDVLFNIYAPAGTKMMYAEPFSGYSGDGGRSWDGERQQREFGSEFETILQQGTKFRISKVTRSSRYDTIYVDIEVIDQSIQQRWNG